MIETLGFEIKYSGDPSVGIFPNIWEMSGSYIFEHEIEEDLFIQSILHAFEYCSDTPIEVSAIGRKVNGQYEIRVY